MYRMATDKAGAGERRTAPRVAIYTRVSRDDTGTGKSNERQEEACRLLAQMRDWEVVAAEGDVSKSAYDPSAARPGWARIEDLMRSGAVDIVIAWKLDRVTRRVSGLVDLILLCQETGTQFATTDGMLDLTSPTGKAVATILAAVAQMEVELKAERQKLANQQRRANGEPWKSGWRSFGYTLDGQVIEEEAVLVREAAADVLTGTPLREIVRRWTAAGVSTPRSEKGAEGWTHNAVRSILLNPKNAAYVTYQGEVIGDGNWEPIIDRDTHALLVAKLTDPARNSNGSKGIGRLPANLLSGIATCAECGEPVSARTVPIQRQEKGKRVQVGRRPVYSCPGYHIALDRESVDNIVVNAFSMAVTTMLPGIVLSIPKRGQGVEAMQALEEENKKLEELADSFSAGRIPLRVLESATAEVQKRIDSLEAVLHTDGDYDPRKLNGESVSNFRNLDTEGQRAVLRRVTRIRLGRKRRGQPVLTCLSMDVKTTNPATGTVTWVPVFDKPEPYEGTNAPLADLLVREQPDGIDTLAKAAAWLSESGKTDKRPSGLASKLSPLVRYDRDQGIWVRKEGASSRAETAETVA
jgi:DNA invertase Pin-like site-specific DNA recombinase